MSQDQFLLKWNNHQNNFVEVFNYLRTQDAFVDVTLACDGKSFSAHKVVLSACSPYFQTLFQTNPCKHPIVFLKDVKGQDMEALIEFIYKGEVSVSQTELGSLISTAENLKIKGLAEPERPLDKSVKRLTSPPRGNLQGPHSTVPPLPSHVPITLFQQPSPSAKRKRCEPYGSGSGHCVYANSRGSSEKEEKMVPNAIGVDNGPSQVVLLPPPPPQDPGGPAGPTDLTPPQPSYVTHHPPLSSSEGVLYSVAGSAIYVGSSQGGGGARGEVVREVYPPPTDPYGSNGNVNEDTAPGPSGVQTPHQNESAMNIKLEPTVPVPPEGWDGSNQSYEDGGAGSDGGGGGVSTPGGVIGSSSDPMSLPLHTDLPDGSHLHDSNARGTCLSEARCLDMSFAGVGLASGDAAGTPDGGGGGGGSSGSSGGSLPCKAEGTSVTPTGSRRLLECEHCHKQFTSRFNLQRHQLIHTGAKPYECPLCHQRFNQSGHVKTHLRTRHPNHEVHQSLSDSNSM